MSALLVVALLAGPLAVAGVAKLVTPKEKLPWPFERGLLSSPKVVGALEVGAALVVLAVANGYAAAFAAVTYAALTAVAWSMRGQRCACFGMARLAAVGKAHIGFNAVAALLALGAFAVGGETPQPLARLATAGLGVAGTLAVLFVADRRARREPAPVTCDEKVVAVRLYVSDDCPSCRSLKHLISTMEPGRRQAVTTRVVAVGSNVPWPGLGVPCAIGLDAAGNEVCTPVDGVGAVKRLIDSITLGVAA